MVPIHSRRVRAVSLAFALPLLAAAPRAAHASGFALLEQNASGLGNAFAGTAAVAEDPSTVFFNPAGMAYLAGAQFESGFDMIKPSAKFHDTGTIPSGTGVDPLGALLDPRIQRPLGSSGGDAGSLAIVPNMYFVFDVMPRVKFGMGVNAPFGQKTNYDPGWEGRFQAVTSSIKTLNVNPSLSWKVNDYVALGVGADWQKLDAKFTQNVNYAAQVYGTALGTFPISLLPPIFGSPVAALATALTVPPQNSEGMVQVTGSGQTWGWNAGTILEPRPGTRIGLSYRSKMKYHIVGTVTFNAVPAIAAAAAANGNVTADVTLPDISTLSLVQQITSKWKVMADASWTHWSVIGNLAFSRDNGVLLQSTPENFRNTWRFALGTTYQLTEKLALRTGIARDQTPINDTDITPRLPDNNRNWVAIGAQYQLTKHIVTDIGYAHLFIKDRNINQNAGSTLENGQISGTYKLSADILAMQLVYKF